MNFSIGQRVSYGKYRGFVLDIQLPNYFVQMIRISFDDRTIEECDPRLVKPVSALEELAEQAEETGIDSQEKQHG